MSKKLEQKLAKEKQVRECISKMVELVGQEHEASAKLWIEKRLKPWGKVQDLRPTKQHLCPNCMYYIKKGMNRYIHVDQCAKQQHLRVEKFEKNCQYYIRKRLK